MEPDMEGTKLEGTQDSVIDGGNTDRVGSMDSFGSKRERNQNRSCMAGSGEDRVAQ